MVTKRTAHFGLLFAAMVHMVVPVYRHVSYRFRWLRSFVPGRLLVVVLGAVGVLALSGSTALNPAVAAFATPDQGTEQGSLTLVSPTDPAWPLPTPYPTSSLGLFPVPTGIAPTTGPYGLTSSSTLTASGIPEPAYRAYVAAAAELARTDPGCAISWTLIAGIGRVESNHGRYGGSSITTAGLVTPPILGIRLDGSRAGTARISDSDGGRYDGDTVFDRAVGPMQFLPGTWKSYGRGANPQNMNAAALATGRYLCAGGGSLATQQGRWAAVYRYNHSDSYVSLVLSLADSYASGNPAPFPTRPSGTRPPATNEPPATTPGPPPSVPNPPTTPPTKQPSPSPTGKPTPSPTGKPKPPDGIGTPTTRPTPSTTTPSPTTTSPSPTETPTPTPTTTPTQTPTPTPTPTGEATCAAQPNAEPTPTPTPTSGPGCPDVEPTSTPQP